jgi:hypothetical protein
MQQRQRPEDAIRNTGKRAESFTTTLRWLMRGGHDVALRSPGEYFLSYFLAAMEACWLNGILIGLAGLDFLHSNSALLPFWGPPLLLSMAIWLFRRALQKESAAQHSSASTGDPDSQKSLAMPGLRALFIVLGLLTACLIWLHVYAARYVLFDPGWLLAFLNDLIALNTPFYQAVIIVAFTIYCCWRGLKLARFDVEPGHVFRGLWAGLLVLMAAILLRARAGSAGTSFDTLVLVLLIPIFLYLALSTHALARIIFVRREHPFGLEGSTSAQERATLSMITGVGLVLLVLTILGGTFFSQTFFNSLHPIWSALGLTYDWLVRAFSQLVAWLMTPFFWLASWWFSRFPPKLQVNRPQPAGRNPSHLLQVDPTSPGIVLATKILLPLLIFLGLILLLRLALRRRKRLRIALSFKTGDIHESLWSWQLFWDQFRAFWQALFLRLFPRRSGGDTQSHQPDEIAAAAPAARTIREIYRALLQKAAKRGHVRKRDETPHEFRQRLDAHEPENEPQLGLLTEAYALTRYGGAVPNEHELAIIRGSWNELEQKWETTS